MTQPDNIIPMPTATVPHPVAVYARVPDPVAYARTVGPWIARSGLFTCSKEEDGIVIALHCILAGISHVDLARTHDLICGKLCLKPRAAFAAFRGAGGSVRWIEDGQTGADAKTGKGQAVAEITTPDGIKTTVTYTMAEACNAGLTRAGGGWHKNPGEMLRARALARGLGMVAPELYAGGDDDAGEVPAPTVPLLPASPAVSDTTKPADAATQQARPAAAEPPKASTPPPTPPTPPWGAQAQAGPPLDPMAVVEGMMKDDVFRAKAEAWMRAKDWIKAGEEWVAMKPAHIVKVAARPDAWKSAIETFTAPQQQ